MAMNDWTWHSHAIASDAVGSRHEPFGGDERSSTKVERFEFEP